MDAFRVLLDNCGVGGIHCTCCSPARPGCNGAGGRARRARASRRWTRLARRRLAAALRRDLARDAFAV